MNHNDTVPTTTNLTVVPDLFPGLESPEMRAIISATTEKHARRIRMDLEDLANAVRWPTGCRGMGNEA